MKPLLSAQPVTQKGDRPSNELVQIIQDLVKGFRNGQLVAWVNFNGTGTVAIRGSANVASITDNGTGDYTVNFTEPLADVNYVVSLAYSNEANVGHGVGFVSNMTVNSFRLQFFNPANSANTVNKSLVLVSVFR